MLKRQAYLILMVSLLAVFNIASAGILPNYQDPNQTIVLTAQTPIFIIAQKANPTTGYSWTVQSYDKNLLTLVAAHYQAPQAYMIGGGGMMMWVFRITPQALQQPTETQIKLLYARPWNLQDNATPVTFTIMVNP